MSVGTYNVPELWAMPRDVFNEWRANNDLPILLNFFKTTLPDFDKWLKEFEIDDAGFCRIVPTSEAFYGTGKKLLVEDKFQEDKFSFFHAYPVTKEQWIARREKSENPLPRYKEFEPYFFWAKKNLGRKRFFGQRPNDKNKTDTFHYNSWSAFNSPQYSRATMQGVFQVLKLGGVALPNGVQIGGRNLDFADLDFLVVEHEWHGSIEGKINFSTCKHLKFKNTRLHHFTFTDCEMEEFSCEQSELYQFHFLRCSGPRQRMVESHLRSVTFENSVLPDFVRCELTDFAYRPSKQGLASGIANNYRRIRSAYQQEGKRQEASEAYFLERTFERKAIFDGWRELKSRPQPMDVLRRFPSSKYGGTLKDIWAFWERGTFSTKDSLSYVRSVAWFKIKIWLPPYLFRTLSFKIRWLFSLIQNILWGYGERPIRIFLVSLFIIGLYTSLYYIHIAEIDRKFSSENLLDAFYFSVVTFTTVGFGDTLPKSDSLKLISCSEALIGAFLMGLSIAGFSNKTRY